MLGSLFHRLTDFSVLRVKLITSDLAAILPSAMGSCTANVYFHYGTPVFYCRDFPDFHRLTDFLVLRVKLITSDLAAILLAAMGLCTANVYFHYTQLFYQIEPLKNWASLILPSSIARNSSAPNSKRIFQIHQGILEGCTNRAWPSWPCLKNGQNGTF